MSSKEYISLAQKSKGRRRKLTEKEEQAVKRWIVGKGPRQYNFDFGLWTREIVSDQDTLNKEIAQWEKD